MMSRFRLIESPHDAVSISLFICKAAGVVLTIIISIFSVLTAIAASESEKCAGKSFLLGFRSEPSDLLAPAIMAVVIIGLFIIKAKPESARQHNARFNWEAFRLGSIRLSAGELAFYGTLISFLVMLGMLTGISVMRYESITSYCQPAMTF